MRHVDLERIEGREIKSGTGSPTNEIKPRTSRSLGESRTDCTKPSFSRNNVFVEIENANPIDVFFANLVKIKTPIELMFSL